MLPQKISEFERSFGEFKNESSAMSAWFGKGSSHG